MSEAASAMDDTTAEASTVSETSEEVDSQNESLGFDGETELPDFNIYDEESEEIAKEGVFEEEKSSAPEQKEKSKDGSWGARIRKDRAQRKKEIEFKKREQFLAEKELQLKSISQNSGDIRKNLLNVIDASFGFYLCNDSWRVSDQWCDSPPILPDKS